uniref:DNA (cytosine-5-)-methyltransferase n=1 Tax=Globodera pallida TaxID=36090 RepID=A0A183CG02_GLOPA
MDEINAVCALEWRKFDFSLLPENVHGLTNFSWKIAIIAKVLTEHSTVIYSDTSIRFTRNNGFQPYFDQIERGLISPWVNPWDTGHSVAFATHPG